MNRRHARTLFSIAAWLAVGLVLTVGVAWALAWHGERSSVRPTFKGVSQWPSTPLSDWPTPREAVTGISHGFIFTSVSTFSMRELARASMYGPPQTVDTSGRLTSCRITIREAGWPWLAVLSEELEEERGRFLRTLSEIEIERILESGTRADEPVPARPDLPPVHIVCFRTSIPAPSFVTTPDGSTVRLPYGPITTGLILDTLFYAAIARGAFGLFQLPAFMRRRSRRRARRCVGCGYDRRGIAAGVVCPECGHV